MFANLDSKLGTGWGFPVFPHCRDSSPSVNVLTCEATLLAHTAIWSLSQVPFQTSLWSGMGLSPMGSECWHYRGIYNDDIAFNWQTDYPNQRTMFGVQYTMLRNRLCLASNWRACASCLDDDCCLLIGQAWSGICVLWWYPSPSQACVQGADPDSPPCGMCSPASHVCGVTLLRQGQWNGNEIMGMWPRTRNCWYCIDTVLQQTELRTLK